MLNKNLMVFAPPNASAAPKAAPSAATGEEQQSTAASPSPKLEQVRDVVDNISEGEFEFPCPPWNDPFDCAPPNEPQLAPDEEDEVRQEQAENGTEIPPIDENTEFAAEIKPDEETVNNTVKIIDGVKRALITVSQAVKEGLTERPKQREYKNIAKFDKIKFGKPKESQPSILPKLLIASAVTIAASVYFGVEANSYYIAHRNEAGITPLKCTFAWLMETDTLQTRFSPMYTDIFFTAFGVTAFIIAAALLLIWDSSAGKKRRREGREHGNARLATPTDFKKYKARFMD